MTWLSRDFRMNWANPQRWTVGVWLTLTVALLAYVLRHGRNAPMWEVWLDLEGLYGVTSPLDWVFGRLQQHRYVLGRALMYCLFHVTDAEFRAGMVVSVGLLSAASAVLLRTVQQLRGRAHFADLLIPLLLMNPGGFENLLLGYQMHFTLDVLVIALLIRCVAFADVRPPRVTAWRVGALAAPLALGGWVGLAFVPGVTAFVVVLVWRGDRRDLLALAVPLLACGYFVWAYADVRRHPVAGQLDNGVGDVLRVSGEFFAMALGNYGVWWSPAAGGAVVLVTIAFVAAQLFDFATSPRRRPWAVGVLAVVLALAMMAYGTGKHRPFGYAVRNVPLLAFLPMLGLFHAVKFPRPMRPALAKWLTGFVVAAALTIHVTGWFEAEKAGNYFRTKTDMFVADRDSGLPLNYLVSRHQMFPCTEVFSGTHLLRSRGHPFARDVRDPEPYAVVGLVVPRPAPSAVPGNPAAEYVVGTPPVWHFALDRRTRVTGVRIQLRQQLRASERAVMQVVWRKPDGTNGVGVCMPWVTPYVWTFDFWVDDDLDEFWLRPLDEGDAFDVLTAQLLVPKV